MASVWWDSQGMIKKDYIEHGKTVTRNSSVPLIKKSTQSNQGQTASQADVRCAADAGQRLSQNSDVISRVWLWNSFASPLFSWPSTLGLLFASENEIWTTTKVIWKQQWRHSGCWRFLRGAYFSLVFLKDGRTRISLANLYWCQVRLYWKTRGS